MSGEVIASEPNSKGQAIETSVGVHRYRVFPKRNIPGASILQQGCNAYDIVLI